jgi:hypothetical protein
MKILCLFLALCLFFVASSAQTTDDHEEFLYNMRLAKTSKPFIPKNGYVPDKETVLAIAYAVAVPIYGKKVIDGEMPLRAELDSDVWTVLGTLNCQSCEGGTLVLQIDKMIGKIVFLTHTK